MKSKLNPVPAANRTQEKINTTQRDYIQLKPDEAQKLVTGIYELDAKVKLKDSQIVTITKQKSDLQYLVTSKTSEVQSKNSFLSQKEQLLVQKEKLLTELKIREENQLKEEYISVLHQLNPKVFSANYEDWTGQYQGYKDLIVKGDYKTIKKHIHKHKQKLAKKIETEKLALATKEAEKLDKAKEEAVSILHQLHPHAYPVKYEDWPTHIKARKLLDSGNLQAIEKNLVVYRELLKKELARQKEEVQNKDQLILQKEQDLKILNDTFTTTISTKEEEIITKNQLLAQEIQSKNQLALQKEEIRIQKEQEIERLRELIAQKDIEIQNKDLLIEHKDELLTQKELENQEKERLREELARKEVEAQELLTRTELEKQELLIQKEREKQELLALKENEFLAQKDELLLVKESEVHNKSAEKNRIIEELANNLLTKDEVIVNKDLKIGEVSQSVKKANRKLAAKDKLLIDKEQRLEELKLLIAQNRIEKEELLAQVVNKSHMKNQIIDELEEEVELKEDEVVNLRIQNLEKELITQQQEKLLIQKESELADKSFAKNQVIGELQKNIGLKEKEAYELKLQALTKALELKEKEVVLKDKALEEARLINELREKEAADTRLINELQGKLLELKALYGHDVSFSQEFSAIQFQAENSIANNDFDAIGELTRYIGNLLEAERENSGTGDLSTLLANLSPIVQADAQVVHQPGVIVNNGNFDIYNQPIYRSIYIEDRSVQPGSSLLERQMESLDLSSMMNHDKQNQAVQPGNSIIALEQMPVPLNQGNIMNQGAQNQDLIGNFDNQHITHSVALSGDEISILQEESLI